MRLALLTTADGWRAEQMQNLVPAAAGKPAAAVADARDAACALTMMADRSLPGQSLVICSISLSAASSGPPTAAAGLSPIRRWPAANSSRNRCRA